MLEPAEAVGAHLPPTNRADLVRDIARGLAMRQKETDPKYFYDERGSDLFELITELPEYYLTRAERALLDSEIPDVVAQMRPRSLIELGAGSASKTRIILDLMRDAGSAAQYVPVDVSSDFLEESAGRLRESYPEIEITTAIGDFSRELSLPELERPALFIFLGSTIGNFEMEAAIEILARIASHMRANDQFLLGVDLRKDVGIIEAAYNDQAGVTAEFNLNMLSALNRKLGANFDASAFRHRAIYNRELHRIEMHLDSLRDQCVSIPGIGDVPFARGESILTELSYKYDKPAVDALFRRAGLRLERWMPGVDGKFALALGSLSRGVA